MTKNKYLSAKNLISIQPMYLPGHLLYCNFKLYDICKGISEKYGLLQNSKNR